MATCIRSEIMIVFAGYTKEMEQFLKTNPVSSILKASSAASTKEIEDIIDNIKKQSKLIQEAIKSTMEVFKHNKGLVENVSDV